MLNLGYANCSCCSLQRNMWHLSVRLAIVFLCFQSDPYWTVETLTARDRSRIGNQTVCSLAEMLRLAARSNSSALLNIRKPPPEHPRYRNWFMDTLWAVQKAGISQKRVRTVGAFIIILWLLKGAACSTVTPVNHKQLSLWSAAGVVLQYTAFYIVCYYGEYCGKMDRIAFWHKTVKGYCFEKKAKNFCKLLQGLKAQRKYIYCNLVHLAKQKWNTPLKHQGGGEG